MRDEFNNGDQARRINNGWSPAQGTVARLAQNAYGSQQYKWQCRKLVPGRESTTESTGTGLHTKPLVV
jgi:hypothetical protein